MSFASILSGPAEERPQKRPSPPPAVAPTAPVQAAPASLPTPQRNFREPELSSGAPLFPRLEKKPSPDKQPHAFEHGPGMGGLSAAPVPSQVAPPVQPRPPVPRKTLTQRDLDHINKIMNDIENTENSDVESPGFEAELERYNVKGKKRAMNTERAESHRAKVCCMYLYLVRSTY